MVSKMVALAPEINRGGMELYYYIDFPSYQFNSCESHRPARALQIGMPIYRESCLNSLYLEQSRKGLKDTTRRPLHDSQNVLISVYQKGNVYFDY